jgi:hypothetical protein
MFLNGVNGSFEDRDGGEFDSRPGPPTTKSDTNVEKLRTLVWNDRRLTVNKTAEELNINGESVRLILTDDLELVCGWRWSQNLTKDQLQLEIEVPSDLFQRIQENDELLNRVITGMQAGLFGMNLRQSSRARNGNI